MKSPALWSPEAPALYSLQVELTRKNDTVDALNRKIGFRKIEWIADKGMCLNGERYTVKGLCCHQDHAGLGVALGLSYNF